MADANDYPVVTDKPKKRKSNGTAKNVAKKARVKAHVTGDNCRCSLLKCFDRVTAEDRAYIINKFNGFSTKNEQDAFLSTLIQTKPIARRRPELPEEQARLNVSSYIYNVRVRRQGLFRLEIVCHRAFLSLFGITNRRAQTIKQALVSTGCPPIDKRGQHNNRPRKLPEDTVQIIKDHISSFRGRKSHYALAKTRRLYLPADLNVNKMYSLLLEAHPHLEVSYETYRRIFVTNFNIGFGFPRKDTCGTCDELSQKLDRVAKDIEAAQDAAAEQAFLREQLSLRNQDELHKRKADTFYARKSEAKRQAQGSTASEAIAFDFQKNLPIPNKTCNDVYYRRQLTFASFNIHTLSTDVINLIKS